MRPLILGLLSLLSTLAPTLACDGKAGSSTFSTHSGACRPGVFLQCGEVDCSLVSGSVTPAWIVAGQNLKTFDATVGIGKLLGGGFTASGGSPFGFRLAPEAAAPLSGPQRSALRRALAGAGSASSQAPLSLNELSDLLNRPAGSPAVLQRP